MDHAAQLDPHGPGSGPMSGIKRKAEPYGWCPTAYRPMMAEDGYLVRVRPHLSRLTTDQTLGLCTLAQRFGNGLLEFTIRSNIQLRGVREDTYAPLVRGLAALDLLDPDAAYEHRRNILMTPLWAAQDMNVRLHDQLLKHLAQLPELPAKMGIGIDCGPARVLQEASADFRFEVTEAHTLILRADGSTLGRAVTLETAAAALVDMAEWFLATGGSTAGRMARHLETTALPPDWMHAQPAPATAAPKIGRNAQGILCAAPAGAHSAAALAAFITRAAPSALRTTPWRAILLEDAQNPDLVDPEHPWEERGSNVTTETADV